MALTGLCLKKLNILHLKMKGTLLHMKDIGKRNGAGGGRVRRGAGLRRPGHRLPRSGGPVGRDLRPPARRVRLR